MAFVLGFNCRNRNLSLFSLIKWSLQSQLIGFLFDIMTVAIAISRISFWWEDGRNRNSLLFYLTFPLQHPGLCCSDRFLLSPVTCRYLNELREPLPQCHSNRELIQETNAHSQPHTHPTSLDFKNIDPMFFCLLSFFSQQICCKYPSHLYYTSIKYTHHISKKNPVEIAICLLYTSM